MTEQTASPALSEVDVATADPTRYAEVLDGAQMDELAATVARTRPLLSGRTVWNVNSTAKGGGVAEMLATLLPYVRGAGIETRWMVVGGDADFFDVTKRIHNHLHGSRGDRGGLDDDDRRHYESVLDGQAASLCDMTGDRDVVVLHDPQTAGLIPALADRGVAVIWRCHVGVDVADEVVRTAWRFLLPYVERAPICVFSRRPYVWEGLDPGRVRIVAPGIDPFSAKNRDMDDATVHRVLVASGLMDGGEPSRAPGGAGTEGIRRRATVVESHALGAETPVALQVSRWDRLKDPLGVLTAFAAGVAGRCDAHLVLAGPSVADVADDPEGAEVFAEVRAEWERLDAPVRGRVHLACLPMDDEEENALMVNALQRRAQVVVQKSLAEGFGLTVAEAMWKGRPVVASGVGGIRDQIVDGESGILLADPRDLEDFAAAVCRLMNDSQEARAMGRAARERVRARFLGSRQLAAYADIVAALP